MGNEEITAKGTFRKLRETTQLMKAPHHKSRMEKGPMADAERGRGRILALLKLKDGVATKDMAEIMGIRVSSLNETLGKLEKDGYIERVPSENDKRIMLVKLTEKGIAEPQPSNCFAEKALADFTDEELAALNGYLDRMANNLAAELGEDGVEMLERMREAHKAFLEGGCEGPRGPHGAPHGGSHGGPHGPHPHGGPDGCCEHHGPHGPHGHGHGPEHHGPHGHGCCHGHGGPHPHGGPHERWHDERCGHHGSHGHGCCHGHGGPHPHGGPHGPYGHGHCHHE